MNYKKKSSGLPHVVIVGAGFAGLQVVRDLKNVPVQITLIDKNNYHLFQPLLYQVATAGLSAPDIAEPIRGLLKKHKNVDVLMAQVEAIDLKNQTVFIQDRPIHYDYLVLAPGAKYNYFGHSQWEKVAPGLKTVEDALLIRKKILLAFEKAEMETDPNIQKKLLTFVIVGAGPTGVELAGSIAELAHKALASDFRHMDPSATRILLIEAGPRILGGFQEKLSQQAQKKLQDLGVEVLLNASVADIQKEGVKVGEKLIPSETILWAAGAMASPLIALLGCETDNLGRAKVKEDLSLPLYPQVFVVGDAACVMQNGKALAGMAPMAKQEGAYVAKLITHQLKGKKIPPFYYFDKGQMATVGRNFAIAQFGNKGIAGFFAWFVWLIVHIFYLIGFQNRLLVLTQWAWAYFTFHRGARVIINEGKSATLPRT